MVLPLRMVRTSPGFGGPAAGHVLGHRRERRHPHPDTEIAAGRQRREHGRRPAHVGLHRHHAVGRLERQAARVERDPLAHQHDVGHPAVDLDRVGRFVGDLQQPGRFGRSPGHAQQAAEAFVGDPLLVPDLERHRPVRTAAPLRRSRRAAAGVSELGGSFTRSRARHTASGDPHSALRSPRRAASGSSPRPITTNRSTRPPSSSLLCATNR